MGAACTRPGAADEAGGSVRGGVPRGRRSSGEGSSSSAPGSPVASAPAGAVRDYASSDWELLTDALRLVAAAELPADTVQARRAGEAPVCTLPALPLAALRLTHRLPPQRYWAKARAGTFHPDEFAEPHVVAVLARCAAQPVPLLGEAPAATGRAPEAPPLLGYAFQYSAGGGGAPLLVLALRGGGGSLDALAAADADAPGTLQPLPPRWGPVSGGSGSDAKAHALFLAAARAAEPAAAHAARAHARQYGSKARILLTGHGLGGAVAAVLALGLAAQLPRAVWWTGFGAPRPGDAAFASAFAAAVGLRAALKHGRDCVPKLPAGPRFAAAGAPLRCGRDDPCPDLPVWSDLGDHGLPRYLAAMQAGPPGGSFFGLPPFELEALAPERALASLANESYKANLFWGQVGADLGAAFGAAVASVPQPPALQLPPLTGPLGDLLASLPGGSGSQQASPSGTPRASDAQAAAAAAAKLVPPAGTSRSRAGSGQQRKKSRDASA